MVTLHSSLAVGWICTTSTLLRARSLTFWPQDTVSHFKSSILAGLSAAVIPSLQNVHGYNEFSVSTPEPVLLKFAKTIYESPLILLLCGSAVISAIMGNIDDAISITVAVAIVLTGNPDRHFILDML